MVKHKETSIRTRDGHCPVHVFTPDSAGPWPAVIVYMDAFGIRPALLQVGERLADGGYVALVPDLFYRYGAYGPLDPKEAFAGNFRGETQTMPLAVFEALQSDPGAATILSLVLVVLSLAVLIALRGRFVGVGS